MLPVTPRGYVRILLAANLTLRQGRATGRTRTDDPVITSDVLYQLSYGGDVSGRRQAGGPLRLPVEPRGFEPLTSALRTLRSPN